MLYVLLSGVLGFVVFDSYRIRALYAKAGVLHITFPTMLGVSIHLFVYVAAGILALFVNLDTIQVCCGWHWLSDANDHLVGPLLRGFGIGLAGPAGLSKGRSSVAGKLNTNNKKAFDDLSVSPSFLDRARMYANVIFMR